MTDSMRQAIGETNRRRAKQETYNRENDITPQSIVKATDMSLARIVAADYVEVPISDEASADIANEQQLLEAIAKLEEQMREAAKKFEFERAAALRDRIRGLKQRDLGFVTSPEVPAVAGANTVNTEQKPDAPHIATGSKLPRK
jgi:excinuclease ABC subunit B